MLPNPARAAASGVPVEQDDGSPMANKGFRPHLQPVDVRGARLHHLPHRLGKWILIDGLEANANARKGEGGSAKVSTGGRGHCYLELMISSRSKPHVEVQMCKPAPRPRMLPPSQLCQSHSLVSNANIVSANTRARENEREEAKRK